MPLQEIVRRRTFRNSGRHFYTAGSASTQPLRRNSRTSNSSSSTYTGQGQLRYDTSAHPSLPLLSPFSPYANVIIAKHWHLRRPSLEPAQERSTSTPSTAASEASRKATATKKSVPRLLAWQTVLFQPWPRHQSGGSRSAAGSQWVARRCGS